MNRKKTLCATCGTSDPELAAICVLPSHHCQFKRRNGNGTNKQISGAGEQDSKTTNRAISPNNRRRNVKTAIVAMLLATASIANASAQDQAAEYRIWSAEQMISRVTEKCKVRSSALNECKALVDAIRVAIYGDAIRWTAVVDQVHKFETEIDRSQRPPQPQTHRTITTVTDQYGSRTTWTTTSTSQ
jgi:hypothetical protein